MRGGGHQSRAAFRAGGNVRHAAMGARVPASVAALFIQFSNFQSFRELTLLAFSFSFFLFLQRGNSEQQKGFI